MHTAASIVDITDEGLHTRPLVRRSFGLHTRAIKYEGTSIGPEGHLISNLFGGPEGGSWTNTKLPDNSAVAPSSAAAVAFMAANMNDAPWLNIHNFTATINVCPPDTPNVPVELVGSRAGASWAQPNKKILAQGVPIPIGLRPTFDSDAELAIYDPKTDRYFELWVVHGPETSITGGWTCEWGGRMPNASTRLSGHWTDNYPSVYDPEVPEPLYEEKEQGAQATSLSLSHTTILLADLLRPRPDDEDFIGYIDHTIGLLWWPAEKHGGTYGGHVWPAQRSDGASATICPQGARFRLPHDWVIDTSKPHYTQMIERCLMEYGAVFCDTAYGGIIRCEPGSQDVILEEYGNIVGSVAWESCVQIKVGNDSNFTPTS